jgi:uncharacterized protein
MLIRFRVANFRSLRDEQEFSMVAAFQDGRKELVHVDPLGVDLLRVAGIYGANAAGKSNVLDAVRFMQEAVIGSHRRWQPGGPIPRRPFLLDTISRSKPSHFKIDFLVERVHFQYGFEIDDEKVLMEWLHAFPNGRRQIWFSREAEKPEPFYFGKHLKGSNRTIERLTRANSLFLSTAAENAHEALSEIYSWFSSRIWFGNAMTKNSGLGVQFTAGLLESEHDSVLNLLRLADLGIVDVSLKEHPPEEGRGQQLASGWIEGINRLLEFKHQSRGGTFSLSLGEQSNGTQVWFSLLSAIIQALQYGSILCIDELDTSLHPYLAMEIIRIFQDPERNPHNAQLIFNTHDTTLLGNLLEVPGLHRDQIWFVEKDEEGASHLYPLTDFKPRKFENVERGYLQGRYGAIPFIGPVVVGEDA